MLQCHIKYDDAYTCCLHTVGVFLRFNNTPIMNNSKFSISDLGDGDHDKIRCYSDRIGCCMSSVEADSLTPQPYEAWMYPNGSVVSQANSTGIFVTKENGYIGLNRINVTMPGGQYCCEAHDGRDTKTIVCIIIQGEYVLYASVTAEYKHLNFCFDHCRGG